MITAKQRPKNYLTGRKKISVLLVLLSLGIWLSCNVPASGINKDLSTGMTTTYKGIKPQKSMMIMNGEVLNHSDIPIGEEFQVVNEDISGLTVKDGQVSVSCSLKITDQAGKVLMDEPDLLKGNNIYLKDSLQLLRCTVSTGEPMKWEEKYDVTVVFRDLYGEGTLENKVTIRSIDIP